MAPTIQSALSGLVAKKSEIADLPIPGATGDVESELQRLDTTIFAFEAAATAGFLVQRSSHHGYWAWANEIAPLNRLTSTLNSPRGPSPSIASLRLSLGFLYILFASDKGQWIVFDLALARGPLRVPHIDDRKARKLCGQPYRSGDRGQKGLIQLSDGVMSTIEVQERGYVHGCKETKQRVV